MGSSTGFKKAQNSNKTQGNANNFSNNNSNVLYQIKESYEGMGNGAVISSENGGAESSNGNSIANRQATSIANQNITSIEVTGVGR